MHASSRFGLLIVLGTGLFACKSGGNSADPAKSNQAPPGGTETGATTSTSAAQTTSTEQTASDTSTASETATDTGSDDEATGDTIQVTGTIALALGLQAAPAVTHVVAMDSDSNAQVVAEVAADGSFSLDVPTDANYVLTYVNANETGEAMLVSTFGSGELDTLATNADSDNVALGAVDVSSPEASSALSEGDLLAAIGMSSDAAATLGAVDDVCLRYSNPDIDADGQVDALANQRFTLDFHNRFNLVKADDVALAMKDIKNAFPPDDVKLTFSGSGIIPWFEDSAYAEAIGDYSWTFSSQAELNDTCANVTGSTLAADTECQMNIAVGGRSVAGKPSIELKAAVPGTYVLKAGGKTFTWTNVAVSDFSGGEGFVALFVRADVNADDKMTGMSWRWRRKTGGVFIPATAEELRLLVASGGGYVSLKVDGANSGKELGIRIPLEPDGTITFADASIAGAGSDGLINLPQTGLTEGELRAGVAWARVLQNPGISYDDKLGMRFFFGFNGSND